MDGTVGSRLQRLIEAMLEAALHARPKRLTLPGDECGELLREMRAEVVSRMTPSGSAMGKVLGRVSLRDRVGETVGGLDQGPWQWTYPPASGPPPRAVREAKS